MNRKVPAGWAAVRADVQHYCRLYGARTLWQRILLPLRAPALLSLAAYRYGRWMGRNPSPLHRMLCALSFEAARRLSGVLLEPWSEIGEGVWIASCAPVFVGARVGAGSAIHAGVTLGLGGGGAAGARGIPTIGEGAILCPGASITGPVHVPAGAVVGPNSVVSRSLSRGGAWLGIPARPWPGLPELLVPVIARGNPS
jgi:serine O-acetyltransferase